MNPKSQAAQAQQDSDSTEADYEVFEDEHDDNDNEQNQKQNAISILQAPSTQTQAFEIIAQRHNRQPLMRQPPPPTAPASAVLQENVNAASSASSSSLTSTSLQTFDSMPHLVESNSNPSNTTRQQQPRCATFFSYSTTNTTTINHHNNTHTHNHNDHWLTQRAMSTSSLGGVDRLPGVHQRFWESCPRLILPKRIQSTQFRQGLALTALAVFLLVGICTSPTLRNANNNATSNTLRVAFVGNSMMYYNDMPRFMEALSGYTMEQDACLHGDATLHSILISGSGTYKIWRTGVAQIRDVNLTALSEQQGNNNDNGNSNVDFTRLYDYGACTVPQLLFGYDATLDQKMQDWSFDRSYQSHGDDYFDDDDYYTMDNDDYDFDSFLDGLNPCLMDPNYYNYRKYMYLQNSYHDDDDDTTSTTPSYYYYYNQNNNYGRMPTPPHWDYIIINDNTRTPAQTQGRMETLSILEQKYLLWFQETGATPILMFTYAYDTPYRDMQGVPDIPTFTSLTYEGYRQYASLLSQRLPEHQQPKIAMVGLAFLTIWEEHYQFWYNHLFHVDRIHASPHGTYLQGCVVYCTIYGRLPSIDIAIGQLESLFNNARRMAPVKHRRAKFPTRDEARYLYNIAGRVCLHGHVPKSFTFYQHGEATDYVPTDDVYKNDDLY